MTHFGIQVKEHGVWSLLPSLFGPGYELEELEPVRRQTLAGRAGPDRHRRSRQARSHHGGVVVGDCIGSRRSRPGQRLTTLP